MENYKNIPISDGTKLCLECGLCCTDVFLGKATIYSHEDRECAKAFNATFISDNGKEYFKLPCPAYEGKCSIYPHTPSVCQKHECNLLKSILADNIKLERALTVVQEIKQVIHTIKLDKKFSSLEKNNEDLSSTLTNFFASTSKEERQGFTSLLKLCGAFMHIRKKYFYE